MMSIWSPGGTAAHGQIEGTESTGQTCRQAPKVSLLLGNGFLPNASNIDLGTEARHGRKDLGKLNPAVT